jgi:uncharacterized protein YoxC
METHNDIVKGLSNAVDNVLLAWRRFNKKDNLIFSDFQWLLESIDKKYEGFEDLKHSLRELSQTCAKTTETVSIFAHSNNH